MLVNRLILAAFVLLSAGCRLFQPPKVDRVDRFALTELTPDHTFIDLSLVVSNPNGFAVRLESLNLTLSDKDKNHLSDVRMLHPMEIDGHQADTVYFNIQLDTRPVAKLISHSADKVDFNVHVDGKAKVLGMHVPLRLDLPQSINLTQILEDALPKIPSEFTAPTIKLGGKKKHGDMHSESVSSSDTTGTSPHLQTPDLFKVTKAGLTGLGFKETQFSVRFMLLNPFGLSFTLLDFPSQVSINGTYAGNGRLSHPLVFDENVSSQEGEIICKLNNWNSLMAGSKALLHKQADYQVNGTLSAAGFGVTVNKPFVVKGHVDIGNN